MQLAELIVKQPIAMRVIVNRIWKGHFGTGIVDTPEQLRFRRRAANRSGTAGISRERVREERHVDQEAAARDHAERGLSALHGRTTRRLPRRIPAIASTGAPTASAWMRSRCAIRFSQVAGRSGRHRSADLRKELTPDYQRRTVYGKVSRYKLDAYLQLFDFPPPNISAEKRFTTTVPLQRLFLMNSDFVQLEVGSAGQARRGGTGQSRSHPQDLQPGLRPRSEGSGDSDRPRLPAHGAAEGIRGEQEQSRKREGKRDGEDKRQKAADAERKPTAKVPADYRRRKASHAEDGHRGSGSPDAAADMPMPDGAAARRRSERRDGHGDDGWRGRRPPRSARRNRSRSSTSPRSGAATRRCCSVPRNSCSSTNGDQSICLTTNHVIRSPGEKRCAESATASA